MSVPAARGQTDMARPDGTVMRSCADWLASWEPHERIPEQFELATITAVRGHAERETTAADARAFAVAIDPLLALVRVFCRGADDAQDAVTLYRSACADVPHYAVEHGVDRLVRDHKFPRPPLPAELLAACLTSPRWERARHMLAKARAAERKARSNASPGASPATPEQRAAAAAKVRELTAKLRAG